MVTRTLRRWALVAACAAPSCAQVAGLHDKTYDPDAARPDGTPAPGDGPTLAGCPMFPADDEWNRDVSGDEVDPDSDTYVGTIGLTKNLHPDWGSVTDDYGIPYAVVPGTQPLVPTIFDDSAEADPGPYPIPPDAPVEAGDRHVLILQQDTCLLYEMYRSVKDASGDGWHATVGARFDLRTGALRGDFRVSADSAGLPVLIGLARVDELLGKREIRHALRFTATTTRTAFVHPATHSSGTTSATTAPPMGMRVRLKASFDTSSFSPDTRVLLTALKKYGMFLADNGSDWYITGTRDETWAPSMDTLVTELRKVHGSDFEVVKMPPIVVR
jgi:hypothetical protein